MFDFRVGNGFDVHKFAPSSPNASIVLCGHKIDHCAQLIAHSDGDVALHALTDALLGALALGDIGKHFPDTDAEYANADSRELLKKAYHLINELGFNVNNADITLIAQSPKMAPHIYAMRKNISQDLNCALDRISVKATTTEGLGFTGRAEGIAVQASVSLIKQEGL